MAREDRRLRLVLDTNVLVAAVRSRTGASNALLLLLDTGSFIPLVSVPLTLEYEAVILRPDQLAASGAEAEDARSFLDYLNALAQPVVLHYLWRPQLSDPADEMVLETAINGRASDIVTFNTRDFASAFRFGISVSTPAEILKRLVR